MKIEFLFNGINDIEELYQITQEENPFGGERVPSYSYIGAAYLQKRMNEVESCLTGIQELSYQQSFGRIANEVFVIIASGIYYEIIFTIDTYEHKKARMKVSIRMDHGENVDDKGKYVFHDGSEYDIFLEQLKIAIKNCLKKDWQVCNWITDGQSEQLCSHLYPEIFKVENEIRAFANKILVHNLGKDWIKLPGLEKYAKSHQNLSVDFKRNVPCFADIDDIFLSMTMETMAEVILKAKIYEERITWTDADMGTVHQKIAENAANSILELVRSKRKVKINIWEDIFKQYFEEEEAAKKAISDFIKNRNHVAHNKLLNWAGYQRMNKNIEELHKIIKKANENFEESIPSEEQYMTWHIGEEEAQEEEERREWERNYLRTRIYGETGIEIRDSEEIFELFSRTLDELYMEFSDAYYFNPKFEISEKYDVALTEGERKVFTVRSNAFKASSIDIIAYMSFDDDMDGDSSMWICCRQNENELFRAELQYHNGFGAEDNYEGKIVLSSESYYDTEELEEFKDDLKDYIEESLNPLIAQKEALEYESVMKGSEDPVAAIPCAECGEYGISVNDNFYPFGHCCFCGEENYIKRCDQCGQWFEEGNGSDNLCEGCLDLMLKEKNRAKIILK